MTRFSRVSVLPPHCFILYYLVMTLTLSILYISQVRVRMEQCFHFRAISSFYRCSHISSLLHHLFTVTPLEQSITTSGRRTHPPINEASQCLPSASRQRLPSSPGPLIHQPRTLTSRDTRQSIATP
ncbi:hypothetical protein BDN71DRAFT_624384 [Pleurotus eryngii]|uniref:Uncharacterized protein n=1 Tax=Pleurotus eryngii TaxID=5323 RepID=A0A9P6A0B5_PLEER|nr:hypothetical protein BDN71DRAFT_624384 [Pleurotus eryngii]